jgi:Mg/Co/Ni transporter MgtE
VSASNDKKEKIKITPQKGGTESIEDNQQTFFKEKLDKEKSKEVKSLKEKLPKEKTDSVLPMMDKKDVATLKK